MYVGFGSLITVSVGMEASAWSVDGLAGAGEVSVLSIGSSLKSCALVKTTGSIGLAAFSVVLSRLISSPLVETTDPVRVLMVFRFKPGRVLDAPSGVGVVFFAAGLRFLSIEIFFLCYNKL
jgi:hypothetical protein